MTALVLGQLVGTGMRSHVFALDDHRVVKVPRDGTPDTWMRREAEYTAAVHALGLPVPAMLELAVHEGRTVVVYQRVLGPSMWAAVIDRPANASLLGQTLAELHLALLHKAAPVSLPRQRDRLACKIRTVREIVGPEIEAQFERRADSRAPMRLCHGDLHPGNVIMSPDGPIVLDWFDASRGEVLAVRRAELIEQWRVQRQRRLDETNLQREDIEANAGGLRSNRGWP